MTKLDKPLAGYVRVSRKGAREELRSPDFQREAIRRYAEAEGFKVELFEPEIDVSGSKTKRPILSAIIERVKDGELGGIVVAKLDRLSRMSPSDRVRLFETIEDAGGVVLSAGEQLDPSTPEGRFAREVFLGIARMQWEKYREQFDAAKGAAIEAGIPVNSRAAVGYRKNKKRRLEPDPRTAPVVREVFERRARGEGPTVLGRFLESRGVKTSQGSRTWSKPAIYGLLSNRVYLGELAYGRSQRFTVANATSHEAIVDLATWQAAQHPNGRQLAPTRSATPGLLSGLLRCAECRYCLQFTKTSRGKRIYRCTRVHAAGICPAPAYIAAEKVEAAAIEMFWKLTRDLEARGTIDDGGDLSALEEKLRRTEDALQQWTSPEVQEAIGDLAEYAAGLKQRRQDRDQAADELGQARNASVSSQELPDVETLSAAWERMTVPERRDLLGLRFDVFAYGRESGLVAYPSGTGPTDLPRRGYKKAPALEPFAPLTR